MTADRPTTRRHYIMDPLPKALRTLPPRERGRGLALAFILSGLFAAAASATIFLDFVQSRLHYLCAYLPSGGGYFCPATAGYFPFAAWVFGAYGVVAIVAALVLAPPARRSRLRRIRAQLLAIAALLPNAIFAYAVGQANLSADLWTSELLLPTTLLTAAAAVTVIAAVIPSHAMLRVCVYLAMALCVTAAVLQPGCLPSTGLALGILVAVLILDYRRSLIR